MNQISMPEQLRECPHCPQGELRYYHEGFGRWDIYFCRKCYGLIQWNGEQTMIMEGEAYPNRNKVISTPYKKII